MKRIHGIFVLFCCLALMGGLIPCISGCSSSTDNTVSPSVVSVTDAQGGTTFTAGQDVIIKGSGFGSAQAAKGGGQSYISFMPQSSRSSPVNATSYILWTDTKIQCTIPAAYVAGSYLVQVNVVSSSGTSALISPTTISIASATLPNITSLVPLTANQGGTITIFGDAFGAKVDDFYESVQNGGYVQFGINPKIITQSTASIWTRTMVICKVPLSVPLGLTQVSIATGAKLPSNNYSVNVVSPTDPTISTITRSTIDVGATTPVTISGTNFGNDPGTGKVTFQLVNGAPVAVASVTSWADTKIVCPTPSSITTAEGNVSVTVLTGSGKTSNSYAIVVKNVGALLHGPRLGLITQKTAAISWDTMDTEIGEVKWGTSTAYTGSLKETTATTRHRLTVEGFSPATTYHYALVAGGKTTADHTFTTAPQDGASTFTFASLADNRGHSDQADLESTTTPFLNILNQMVKRKLSFALHAGDIFFGNTQSAVVNQLYDTFKNGTDPFCAETSMLFSPGNHEMQGLTDPQGQAVDPLVLFNQQFAQPTQLAGYEGTCYSFDWGNSHFVSVDSCHYDPNRPYGGMAYISDKVITWLDSDLKSAQEKKVCHIFVFSHTNAFSQWKLYYLGSVDQVQRDKFWSVLVKYKVDAYICGHDHLFNDQLGKDGVVQWLNGNSGSVTPGNGPNQFTIWRVNGDTVEAELLNDTGESAYKRTIQSSQPK